MSQQEFRYKVKTYVIFDRDDAEKMRSDLEKMFNDDWKPTTSGPCLALPMTKLTSSEYQFQMAGSEKKFNVAGDPVESTTWFCVYVFAKERSSHAHVN